MPQVKSLRWEQIDPRIAAQVGQTLATSRSTDASATHHNHLEETRPLRADAGGAATLVLPASATTRTLDRTQQLNRNAQADQLEPIWTLFSATVAFLIVGLYLSICFNLTGPLGTLLIALLPVAMIGACIVPAALTGHRALPPGLRGPITLDKGAEQVRGAFASAKLERAERLYGDVILHLAAPQEATREQVRLRRTLLRRCNALLADHFRISEERTRVQRLLERSEQTATSETLARVEQELSDLTRRRDGETDPIARASLVESVKLCEERLLSLHALGPTLARLDAHDEAICQALSLAHAVLTHADASPVALTMPDVASVRRALRQTGRDLRAMEAAVEELEDAVRR